MKNIASVPFVVDLETKAATEPVELADGELLLEGWALTYEIDREDEAFGETGAIHKALKKFAEMKGPVCHHHDYKIVLGRVIEAEPIPGRGVKVRAIIDDHREGKWSHLYKAIKSGSIRHLSLGGIFKRKMTTKGPIIHDADFLELSVCGTSVGRGTSFSVVAGKALKAPYEGKADLTEEEQAVVAAERELGDHDKEMPETPSPMEPAPELTEEEKVQREEAERAAEEEATKNAKVISAADIPASSITSEMISAGSITVDHFDDDVRSRFQELKPDSEGPTLEDLAAVLAKFDSSLDRVAKRVGVNLAEEERETTPTTGPVIMS